MSHSRVAIIASTPVLSALWMHSVAGIGAYPLHCIPGEAFAGNPQVCLVAFSSWQSPRMWETWLRQLSTPLILITPHTMAAQTLIARVASVRLIVQPLQALAHLADILALAIVGTAGTLIIPPARDARTSAPHTTAGFVP